MECAVCKYKDGESIKEFGEKHELINNLGYTRYGLISYIEFEPEYRKYGEFKEFIHGTNSYVCPKCGTVKVTERS